MQARTDAQIRRFRGAVKFPQQTDSCVPPQGGEKRIDSVGKQHAFGRPGLNNDDSCKMVLVHDGLSNLLVPSCFFLKLAIRSSPNFFERGIRWRMRSKTR